MSPVTPVSSKFQGKEYRVELLPHWRDLKSIYRRRRDSHPVNDGGAAPKRSSELLGIVQRNAHDHNAMPNLHSAGVGVRRIHMSYTHNSGR